MHRELVKGTLDTMILHLLSNHGRLYGYQITKMVHESSEGVISIKEGSLYPSLHKMEKNGMIQSEIEHVNNRPRKYYSITPAGSDGVKEKRLEISNFIMTLEKVLNLNKPGYVSTNQ